MGKYLPHLIKVFNFYFLNNFLMTLFSFFLSFLFFLSFFVCVCVCVCVCVYLIWTHIILDVRHLTLPPVLRGFPHCFPFFPLCFINCHHSTFHQICPFFCLILLLVTSRVFLISNAQNSPSQASAICEP